VRTAVSRRPSRRPSRTAFVDRYGPAALVTGASSGTGRALAREVAVRPAGCHRLDRRRAAEAPEPPHGPG
jgi:hypothetical protein